MTKAVIDFTENGIHYHAEKGFVFAKIKGVTRIFTKSIDNVYKVCIIEL